MAHHGASLKQAETPRPSTTTAKLNLVPILGKRINTEIIAAVKKSPISAASTQKCDRKIPTPQMMRARIPETKPQFCASNPTSLR